MMRAPTLDDTTFPSLQEGLLTPIMRGPSSEHRETRSISTHMRCTPLHSRNSLLAHERRAVNRLLRHVSQAFIKVVLVLVEHTYHGRMLSQPRRLPYQKARRR